MKKYNLIIFASTILLSSCGGTKDISNVIICHDISGTKELKINVTVKDYAVEDKTFFKYEDNLLQNIKDALNNNIYSNISNDKLFIKQNINKQNYYYSIRLIDNNRYVFDGSYLFIDDTKLLFPFHLCIEKIVDKTKTNFDTNSSFNELKTFYQESNFKIEINEETSSIKYNNHDITLKDNKINISNNI